MLYAKSQNPHAIVHCYEPVPACAKHVAHTAYINNMSDVHVHEIAVSSAKGQQQLFLGTQTVAASLYEGIASGSEAISIETDTFASILSDNNMSSVEFVKVDCEG